MATPSFTEIHRKSPLEGLQTVPDQQRKRWSLLKVARDVLIMCQVCKMFRRVSKNFREFEIWGTFGSYREKPADMITENMKKNENYFDSKQFAIVKDRFPASCVLTTKKLPAWRTEEEVKLLSSTLQILSCFRHYSKNLQFLLAKVVRYERFERRRVIVKKGHRGSSFYFIYSGVVAVTKDEDGSSAFVDKEPILLRKGSGFGEVALLKGLQRNATVVCMEDTEVLVVDKEDFFANKLDEQLQKEFQYRFSFFRSLDLFASWPDKSIEEIADRCKTQEFRYGQVTVNDTSDMANIIFVSKGRCNILRLVNLSCCPSYQKWIRHQTDPVCIRKPKTVLEYQQFFSCRKLLANRPQSPQHFSLCHLTNADSAKETSPYSAGITTTSAEGKCATSRLVGASEKKAHKQTSPVLYDEISGAAVYMRVGVVQQGQFFGLNQYLVPIHHKDYRSMVLVSQGAEIIKVKIDKFNELVDQTTLLKLKKLESTYPSDDRLCQIFLQHNHWKAFKKDLIQLVLEEKCKPGRRYSSKDPKHSPTRQIDTSWNLDNAGVLDLSAILNRHTKITKSSEYRSQPASTRKKETFVGLPNIEIRLIHGIDVPQPNIKRLFY